MGPPFYLETNWFLPIISQRAFFLNDSINYWPPPPLQYPLSSTLHLSSHLVSTNVRPISILACDDGVIRFIAFIINKFRLPNRVAVLSFVLRFFLILLAVGFVEVLVYQNRPVKKKQQLFRYSLKPRWIIYEFKYIGATMITNDGRDVKEIKTRIRMAK